MMAEPRLIDEWDRALLILPILNSWCRGEDDPPISYYDAHPYREEPTKTETHQEFDERFFWDRIQMFPPEMREKIIKKRYDSQTS